MRYFVSLITVICLLMFHGTVYSSNYEKQSDLNFDQQIVYSIYVNNEWCMRNSPGYAGRIGDTYALWITRHEKEIAELKAYPNFDSWVTQTDADNSRYAQWTNTNTPVDDIHAAFWTYAVCNDEFIAMTNIKDLPDERFSSPIKTYKLFIRSLAEGDYATAYACLTRNGIRDYLNYLLMTLRDGMEPAFKKEDMPVLLDDGQLVEEYIDDNTAEVHDTGNSTEMTFKKILGNWKSTF